MTLEIFTIGHSNQSLAQFANLLNQYDIDTVVDVRSAPYSKYVPHFSKEPLEKALPHSGINYKYLGFELGGKPKDPQVKREGKVDFQLVRQASWFQQGLEQLIELGNSERVAIMCAEEDPTHCHRNKLVAASLRTKGIIVSHIRKDGIDRGNTSLDNFF